MVNTWGTCISNANEGTKLHGSHPELSGSVSRPPAVARKPCCRQASLPLFSQPFPLTVHNLPAIDPKQNTHPPFAVLLLWQHSRCVSACGLYSSIAKPPRKCLLCVGDLWLGSLSPDSLPSRIWSWVPLLTPTSSALWYSFLSGREILLFSYQLPVELQFREVEERSSTVTLIDLYLSLFHHRMQ